MDRIKEHAFVQRRKDLEREENALALQVYHDLHGLQNQALMDKLPSGWFELKSKLTVEIDFQTVRLSLKEQRKFAYRYSSGIVKIYPPNHDISRAYLEYKKVKDQLSNEEQKASHDARALLNSVTTLKKLLEIWPQVEPFVKDFWEQEKSAQLPALPIQSLNAMLNMES